jgi:hypothetical protein
VDDVIIMNNNSNIISRRTASSICGPDRYRNNRTRKKREKVEESRRIEKDLEATESSEREREREKKNPEGG